MNVFAVQDSEGNILGIYDDRDDATDRQEELMDEGWEDVIVTEYRLNADVELYDDTNVVQFVQ